MSSLNCSSVEFATQTATSVTMTSRPSGQQHTHGLEGMSYLVKLLRLARVSLSSRSENSLDVDVSLTHALAASAAEEEMSNTAKSK